MKTQKRNAWVELPLSEIAKIERNSMLPSDIKSGTKYVGLEHINGDGNFVDVNAVSNGDLASNKFVFTSNHILYGKLRPYLRKIALPNFNGICSTDILPISPGPEIDKAYLYYYLRKPEMVELATTRCTGANLPRLSPKTLAQFPVPIPTNNDGTPDLDKQSRIAAILDKADGVRRKRQEAIRLTDELLLSAFLEMFGDPVTNPKGWDVRQLESTFAKKPQIGTTKPAHIGGKQLVIRVGELGGHFVALEKCGSISLEGSAFEKVRCQAGDFLLARAIGSEEQLGKASILQNTTCDVVFDSHVMRLRFDENKLSPVFFHSWLRTKGGRACFMKRAGRTAVQFNVNAKQIAKVGIALPPIELQNEYVSFHQKSIDLNAKYTLGSSGTTNLFNSLVQRAFRGEL